MTTAREAFEAKKLEARYGVVGKVAALYRRAGFDVKVVDSSEDAPVNFVAKKKGERLAVRVYKKSGKLPLEVVEELAKNAGEGFKAILVVYGAGPKITGEALAKAKELGVSIRRVRV